MMRRRPKDGKNVAGSAPVANKEIRRQQNVLTPLILALTVTLVVLMSTPGEEDSMPASPLKRKDRENLINVPNEQALLEADKGLVKQRKMVGNVVDTDIDTFAHEGEVFDPTLHNNDSLLQHIWYRGNKFDGKRLSPVNTTVSLSFDSLSIATERNIVTLEGQATSWAAHHSIRYLFGATELDDAHPDCQDMVTMDDMKNISEFCSGRAWRRSDPKIRFIRNRFARGDFMVRYRKTPGWMCAQQRLAHSMAKLGRFYRRELAVEGTKFKLPDFLLIQDDDTFYNLLKLYPFLEAKDPSKPTADAGCLVRWPRQEISFDYPYGGFGLMLSQAALERWIRPIHCLQAKTGDDAWEKHVCSHIESNLIGEGSGWKDGMSITDIMHAQAKRFPFQNYHKWEKPGYCIHGDWVMGYYLNYYAVTQESTSFADAGNLTRIDQTLGYSYDKPEGNCKNEGQPECTLSEASVCHRLHGVSQNFLVRQLGLEQPEAFRKVSKKTVLNH